MLNLANNTLKLLFVDARSQNGWTPAPVSESELRQAYDIAKWGPTSMNSQPMRLVFLRSSEAKERLKPALSPGNVTKVMTAPVVAIVAYDIAFYEHMPRLFPHNLTAKAAFAGKEPLIQSLAFRNGTLQAAYFILAIRAVGLDAGPMSGFEPTKVDAEFFADTSFRTNFLIGIGHGDPAKLFNRAPHFELEEVASFL